HADNVAPCILGKFTIIHSYDPFEVFSIEPPEDLGIVAVLPDVMVATADSRKVLPKTVEIKDLVFHVGQATSLVHALHTGDIDLIGRSVGDAVFEPARTKLVPHLKDAEKAAMENGAIASFLGGSGPSIISFFKKSEGNGQRIADAIRKVYTDNKMHCDAWVTTWGTGCRRL
ncbi:MAG: homoserine kinase, partial [Candidatus Methanomethylophilaceae archaeon]|nr:homoserine kinase [Candidatus Methanomethylophilaceae archaeon]